jgi:hypothetical protein
MGKRINREEAKGKAAGIARGIKRDDQSPLTKIAAKLLSKGTSIEKIAYLTELTERDIKGLLNHK